MTYINWRSVPGMPGTKPRKLPWDAVKCEAIDHLDPANWLDWETCNARCGGDVFAATVLPRLDGSGSPVTFLLDLDGARDASTGEIAGWARDVLAAFPGAWSEVSHSGTGFHIMGRCLPGAVEGLRNKWTPDGAPHNAAEFYCHGRFVAMGQGGSGDSEIDWTDTLLQVVPARDSVAASPLVDEGRPAADYSGPQDDAALIELMRQERLRAGGDLAPGLFAADFFGPMDAFRARVHATMGQDVAKMPPWDFDASSVDFALMNHLAFYTGGDVERMARLHGMSVMGSRDKAISRPGYVQDSARTAAREAVATGRYLSRPTVESVLRQVQDNPTNAVERLAGAVAGMSAADRSAVIDGCRDYGIKGAMAAAVKMLTGAAAVDRGAETLRAMGSGPLASYYIVQNENGQSVAIDSRGGTPPQSRAALRDAFAHLPAVAMIGADGNVRSIPAVDAWWQDDATPRYDMTGYHPGEGIDYVDASGRRVRNTYVPGHAAPAVAGDIEPWLYVVRVNFPDPGDQAILMRALAAMVQRPDRLLRWSPVLQGTQGCGKGTIAEAVTYAHGRHNVSHPSPDIIARDFNAYMHRKTLVVVNEIGDHTKRELSSLAEKLKPWITDSPVHIEAKGRDGFDAPNHCNWIFTTNHQHCMLASAGERRYAHFISVLQTEAACAAAFPGDWWSQFRTWWDAGGADAVRAWLLSYDIGTLPSVAPETTSTAAAVAAAESDLVTAIREGVADDAPGFRGGWLSLNAVSEALAENGLKRPHQKLLARQIAAMGFNGSARVNTSPAEAMRFPGHAGTKTRLYWRGDLGEGLSGADVAAAYDKAQTVEPAPVSGVVVPFAGR